MMDTNRRDYPLRDPVDAEDYFWQGIDYVAAEDYEMSIAAFNQAVQLNPTNAKYYYQRATSHFIVSKWSEAIADYMIALRLKPDPNDDDRNFTIEEVYDHRAIAYRYQGEHEAALADYAQLIQLQPNNSRYYLERSAVHKIKEDFENALADLDAALRLNPTDSTCYISIADIHLRHGNRTVAMAAYNEALERGSSPAVYYCRGQLWKAQGDLNKAIADFEAAIKGYPRYYEVYLTLGETYLAHSNFTQVIDVLNAVMKGREDFRSSALVLRAKAYTALGDLEQADKDFDEAIIVSTALVAKYSGFALAYVARGQAYAARGHVSEAIANFQKALTLPPTLADADMMHEYIARHS